jgi:hypothetical protein
LIGSGTGTDVAVGSSVGTAVGSIWGAAVGAGVDVVAGVHAPNNNAMVMINKLTLRNIVIFSCK